MTDPYQHQLMTVEELAKNLGKSPQTVYWMVREKGLPCVRDTRRAMRFDRQMVADWFDQQRTK